MIRKAKPAWEGYELTFDEGPHTYHLNNDEIPSVSSVLGGLFPFDFKAQAVKSAKTRGITTEEMLAQWDAIRERGSLIHRNIEAYVRGDLSVDVPDLAISVLQEGEVLYCEEPLCSPTYKLAGTADIIMRNAGGQIVLRDWKTGEITKPWGNKDYIAHPLGHYDRTKFTRYCLQLGIYANLVEEWLGLHVDYMCLDAVDDGYTWDVPLEFIPAARQMLAYFHDKGGLPMALEDNDV